MVEIKKTVAGRKREEQTIEQRIPDAVHPWGFLFGRPGYLSALIAI